MAAAVLILTLLAMLFSETKSMKFRTTDAGDSDATPTVQIAPVDAKPVPLPQGRVVFQPVFRWEDGAITAQGTGFVIQTPAGIHAGVTSAHFINFEGPPLLAASWNDVVTDEVVAQFRKSWGKPGNAGSDSDLRADYLILPAEGLIEKVAALELDERPLIPLGERVYFPNKAGQKNGYVWLEGSVVQASSKKIAVKLDHEIRLQSQSGSPVISQTTGKVIGTLARAVNKPQQLIFLCPSKGIAEALNTVEHPLLKNAIGVAGAQRKE